MANKFFHGINTLEELKKAYRKMALIHHPDRGGNEKDFIALKDEFDRLFKVYEKKESQGTYTDKKTGEKKTYERKAATEEEIKAYQDIIDQLIFCEGLEIEIIGTWIWVTGETKAHKEKLKELKFSWSKFKQAWSWHTGEWKRNYRGKNNTMDDIRNMHDSKTVKKRTKKPQLTE